MLRRLGAIALIGVGLYCAMVSLLAVSGRDLLEHTIEHSKQIELEFRKTAEFADAYRQLHGGLPNDEVLSALSEKHQRQGEYFIVSPGEGQFGKEAVKQLGVPRSGDYLIGMWRGEWMEYFAPSSGRTTLTFNERDYYALGSRRLDIIVGGLSTILAFGCAIWLWLGRRPRDPAPRTA